MSLMHKLEFEYKKTKLVPGYCDVARQLEFIKEYEKIKADMAEDEEILFLDGMHKGA